MRRLAIALLLPIFAAACRSSSYQTVPMPDQGVDLERRSNGRVYLVREDQTLWRRIPLLVHSAGDELARLGPGAYLCWEREPGRVLARLTLDRSFAEGGPVERLYDARIEAGELAWIRVRFDQVTQELVPERLDEEAGRALVARSEAADER